MADISERKRKILVITIFILLFLLSSLRWNVGVDTWHTYTPEYLTMKSQHMELSQEEVQLIDGCYKLWARMDQGLSKEQAELLSAAMQAVGQTAKRKANKAIIEKFLKENSMDDDDLEALRKEYLRFVARIVRTQNNAAAREHVRKLSAKAAPSEEAAEERKEANEALAKAQSAQAEGVLSHA